MFFFPIKDVGFFDHAARNSDCLFRPFDFCKDSALEKKILLDWVHPAFVFFQRLHFQRDHARMGSGY